MVEFVCEQSLASPTSISLIRDPDFHGYQEVPELWLNCCTGYCPSDTACHNTHDFVVHVQDDMHEIRTCVCADCGNFQSRQISKPK
jgi:hypothetical protein